MIRQILCLFNSIITKRRKKTMIQVINKCLKKRRDLMTKYKSNDNDYVEMGLTNTNLQKIG